MSKFGKKLKVKAPIAEIRQAIVDDAFEFYNNGSDAQTSIIDFSGLKVPAGEHPKPEVMGKALVRCDAVWKEYCRQLKLPGETQRSFMKAFEVKWKNLEKSSMQRRKRKETTG